MLQRLISNLGIKLLINHTRICQTSALGSNEVFLHFLLGIYSYYFINILYTIFNYIIVRKCPHYTLRTCFVLYFQAKSIIKTAYLTLTITGQYRRTRKLKLKDDRRTELIIIFELNRFHSSQLTRV